MGASAHNPGTVAGVSARTCKLVCAERKMLHNTENRDREAKVQRQLNRSLYHQPICAERKTPSTREQRPHEINSQNKWIRGRKFQTLSSRVYCSQINNDTHTGERDHKVISSSHILQFWHLSGASTASTLRQRKAGVENKSGAVMARSLETLEPIHMRITGMIKRVETVNKTSIRQLKSTTVHMSV